MTIPSASPAADRTSSPTPLRGQSLGFAIGVYLLAVVMFLSNMVVLSWVGPPDRPFAPTPAAFAASAAAMVGWGTVMVYFVLVRLGGLSLATLGWRPPRLRRSVAEGAAGFVVAAAILLALTTATGSSPFVELTTWLVGPSTANRALWLIIGIGAPFIEESVFRGLLQPVLSRKLGRIGGVLVMAVLFSLYHLPRGPLPLVGRFLLGLVFGVLRARTDGLVAPAVAHFLVWVVVGTR